MTEEIILKDRNLYVVQLTSLRGIACLVVLVGHAIQVVNYHYTTSGLADVLRQAVTGAVNAEGAVLVFFVLSGCVLALSLKNVTRFDLRIIGAFYIKRIFRLYPLLWLSLIFAVFSMAVAHDLARAGIFSEWLNGNILTRISLVHSLLSLTGLYTSYNGPIWSLRVELIYSALFPVIYMLVRQVRCRKWTLIFLGAFALMPIPQHFGTGFAVSFAVGACIPMLPARKHRLDLPVVIVSLAVLMFDRLVLAGLHPPEHVFDLFETAAAFFIVRDIYAAATRYRFLLSRPAVLLGELSFSIYLLHLPIFLIIFTGAVHYVGLAAILNHSALSQIGLSIATAAVTIFISGFTYNWVELPMHNIGRRLGKLLAARQSQPASANPSLQLRKAPSA
jgi:peptidoglycan/LPS O-acetylase OafA/YrhL